MRGGRWRHRSRPARLAAIARADRKVCSAMRSPPRASRREAAAEGARLDAARESCTGEKEMLGFYVTGHPLDQYEDKVRELATHDSGNLEGLAKGVEVALCGVHHRRAAQAQSRGQALGVDAARRPHRRGRSAALHHATTSAWPRCWSKIRRCWCAAWCCRKRMRRPRFRCRRSCRSKSRACRCLR